MTTLVPVTINHSWETVPQANYCIVHRLCHRVNPDEHAENHVTPTANVA